MDSEQITFVSVILTAFNGGHHMDRILQDVSCQNYPNEFLEILILEAGEYPEERAKKQLGDKSGQLHYWRIPALSRTAALNHLVRESKGNLIVRLDVRTHIQPDYLERIVRLSKEESVANVGGVQVPVGESVEQIRIAKFMRHPLCFGGGKFRDQNYSGQVDSVYLGAFSRSLMFDEPWFDEKHPKISEDSDLNFRIRQSGGRVVVDSGIKVQHYPRETFRAFVELCFNYGVGRGIFFVKNKQFSAGRQLVLPTAFIIGLILLGFGILFPFLHLVLLTGIITYLGMSVIIAAGLSEKSFKETFYFMFCFMGCHFFWTLGFFKGVIKYE